MDNIMDYYEIHSDGRVYSNKTSRFLKLAMCGSGYYKVVLRTKDGKSKNFMNHRLVALKFIPNVENKREVNHINGNKLDNRVENLEWVTPIENMKHAKDTNLVGLTDFEKGGSIGSKNKSAKLTEEIVIAIRTLGLKYREFLNTELSKQFDIGKACYNQLMRRYTWNHI